MHYVSINLLRANTLSTKIYGLENINGDDYLALKGSIQRDGILTPLVITRTNLIISGVRRYMVAKELGFTELPCVFKEIGDGEVDEYLIVAFQQQRIKTRGQIAREVEIINRKYNLRQGLGNTDPNVVEGRKLRSELMKGTSSTTNKRMLDSKNMLLEMEGLTNDQAWNRLVQMEKRGGNPNNIYNSILKEYKVLKNEEKREGGIIPIPSGAYQLYNKNAMDLSFIEDDSVDCIITSPPYFNRRDYHHLLQIGIERRVEEYISNLSIVFGQCKSKLKDTGSLFINIADVAVNGVYLDVPALLRMALKEQGWLYVSQIIWVKNNPIYQDNNRPQPCYEVIIHLVKSKNYKYYKDWAQNEEEFGENVCYGGNGRNRQLRDFWDFRTQTIRTNGANIVGLKKLFKEHGYNLNHDATFPVEVPTLAILSTTQPGDVVLDCMAGISTTGVCALAHNRNYIGVELNPEFAEMSKIHLNHFLESVMGQDEEQPQLNLAA